MHERIAVNVHLREHAADQTILLPCERKQQMLLIQLLVMVFVQDPLCVLNRFNAFLC